MPTGAVRVSFGYMSSFEDAVAVVKLLRDYFLDGPPGDGPLRQDTAGSVPVSPDQRRSMPATVPEIASCGCQLPAGCPRYAAEAAKGEAAPKVAAGGLAKQGSLTLPDPDQLRWSKGLSLDQHSDRLPIDLVSESRSSNGRPPQLQNLQTSGLVKRIIEPPTAVAAAAPTGAEASAQIQGLWLYPVKSCAAQGVARWPLGPNGLLYDREWALVDPEGRALNQRRHPRLVHLIPTVDLDAGATLVFWGFGYKYELKTKL